MSSLFVRLRPWLAVAIGLALLTGGILWVGVEALLTALRAQSPQALALALVMIVAGTLLGAWNSFRIAELRAHLSFLQFLPVYWKSWAIGLSVPGQVGDIVSTLWQLRDRTGSNAFLAGRLIADKVVTIMLVLVLLTALPGLLGQLDAPRAWALPAGTLAALLLGTWFARSFLHPADPAGRSGWRAKLAAAIRAMHAPLGFLAINAAITAVKLVLTGLAYWALLAPEAMRPGDLLVVLAVSQSAGLVAYLPISFNGIGTVELSAIYLFGLAGFAAPQVLAAYVLLRVLSLSAAWLPVLVLWLREARKNG